MSWKIQIGKWQILPQSTTPHGSYLFTYDNNSMFEIFWTVNNNNTNLVRELLNIISGFEWDTFSLNTKFHEKMDKPIIEENYKTIKINKIRHSTWGNKHICFNIENQEWEVVTI